MKAVNEREESSAFKLGTRYWLRGGCLEKARTSLAKPKTFANFRTLLFHHVFIMYFQASDSPNQHEFGFYFSDYHHVYDFKMDTRDNRCTLQYV